jgi:general secretion pathway protein K
MTPVRSHVQHGAALVLVLWLIALLTALVGAFALSARIEQLQQRVQDDTGRAQEIGRAGVAYAMSRLRADPTRPPWQPDGRPYRWQFDGAKVDIRIEDEGGKINLNLADPALLEGFLQALDVPQAQATQLAGAIIDWRDADDLSPAGGGAELADYVAAGLPYGPRNARFETVGELQRVLGVTPALYRQMRPMLTLHGRQSRPDGRFARGPVLAALGLDPALVLAQREQEWSGADDPSRPASIATGSGTYSIDCRVTDDRGRIATSRAVVRSAQNVAMGRAYTVLEWEQGMASQ